MESNVVHVVQINALLFECALRHPWENWECGRTTVCILCELVAVDHILLLVHISDERESIIASKSLNYSVVELNQRHCTGAVNVHHLDVNLRL